MSDVIDVLRNLPPGAPAGNDVVAADVDRGRRAATRRRRNRFGAALAAVAVVAAAGIGAGVTRSSGTPESGAVAARTAGTGADRASGTGADRAAGGRIELVSYTGRQPSGFRVSTVPKGWTVVLSESDLFMIAPPGGNTAATDANGMIPAAGRISVSMQGLSSFPDGSKTQKYDINGAQGLLGHPRGDDGTRWLFFPAGPGKVQVSVPGDVPMTDDQIAEFARGIAVTDQVSTIGG